MAGQLQKEEETNVDSLAKLNTEMELFGLKRRTFKKKETHKIRKIR